LLEEIKFTHLGMEGKHFADALVTLTSMARIDFGHKVQPVHIDIRNNPAHCCSVEREINGNPWYYNIKNFIQKPDISHGGIQNQQEDFKKVGNGFQS